MPRCVPHGINSSSPCAGSAAMTRGLQKAQAQKKNAAAQQDKKGTQKGEGVGKMGGAVRCPVCKVSAPLLHTRLQVYERARRARRFPCRPTKCCSSTLTASIRRTPCRPRTSASSGACCTLADAQSDAAGPPACGTVAMRRCGCGSAPPPRLSLPPVELSLLPLLVCAPAARAQLCTQSRVTR